MQLSPISQHRNLTGIPQNNRLSLTPFRKKKPHNPRRPLVAPEASTVSTASAPSPAEPGKTADVAPDEEPPGKLRPGESVTAVLHNFGRAEYAPGKGESFFVELKNRSGSKLYWGEQLESLVKTIRKVTW
uniref:DNA primase n=1 Tax=Escherichia coli TaxID=562 RepID=A0A3G4RTP7_ECOLX|nr:DNA primase [Escherichia coli]